MSTALSRARGEDERLAALDKQIAAYNEAKGFIRHALSTTAGVLPAKYHCRQVLTLAIADRQLVLCCNIRILDSLETALSEALLLIVFLSVV